MSDRPLTTEQLAAYHRDGFTIMERVFDADMCARFIEHMMDLHRGVKTLEGFGLREPGSPGEWGRTFNQHLYDPKAMDLLLHPCLREPLRQCYDDEPEGIQTMYFYVGSEQRRHQDQYYLPACMSAWIALTDVNADNGTIWVQPGSHKGHLVTAKELRHTHGQDFSIGEVYNDAVDAVFEHNQQELGLEEAPVEVHAGDVVLFHGVLIHRGGPIRKPGSFRHVMANHYLPDSFDDWPYPNWARYAFDGSKRFTGPQPTEGKA